ncbi:MAG TPA: SusC/RagA family TonB-linked outer membrane protein [Puia sp.]|jgi:TonB-linked SusC/RagA family outer membrane protein
MKHLTKCLLLFFLLAGMVLSVQAQKKAVSGTVVKEDTNEPLQGVTVTVKGTTQTAITDAKGFFSMTVANRSKGIVLVFSYVGFEKKEMSSAPDEILTVPLTVSNKSMNDVVIVGYGSQKRSSLTGSVSTVDLKKVEDVPALDMTAALRGTVPGLSVSGGVQRPGQPTTVTIRNPVAFAKDGGQGTNPLFIIDDVIRTQADFDLLDVTQVESVSVLKDAEASIYGVQGANGVIIVKTKRGHAGAPTLSFSGSVGSQNATILPKMLNSLQLATLNNDYNQTSAYQQTTSSGVGVPVNQFYDTAGYLHKSDGTVATTRLASWYTPDELAYFSTHSHNYLKQAFKTAYVERGALNLSGGTDKLTYFIGGDFVNQSSNFKGINSYKYGLRATVDAKPAKGLDVMVSLSDDIFYSKSYWYKINSTTESLDNDVASLETVQPWQEYFINGNPVITGASNTGGYDNVNLFLIQNSNNFTTASTTTTNILGKITYEIPGVKGLSGTFTMNKNINTANGKQFGSTFTYSKYAGMGENNHIPGGTLLQTYPISNGNRVRLNPTFSNSYQLDAGLSYMRSFGKHTISAIALYEQREQNAEGIAGESDGVVNGALPYQTFTTGAESSTQTGFISQFGFEAFISRLNYSYAGKYLLQLVYRADGSSRFAAGHNWGGFPAASVGWILSEEPFIRDKYPWIDLLKVRASAGLTGTDNTKPYQYRANYNLGTGSSGGAVFNEGARSIGVKPNIAIPNVGVTWDHVTKLDYGLDMAVLNNRLNFSADYFWSHGYDLLTTLSSSVPVTIGAAAPTENFSIVNMFGYEVSVGWRGNVGKKFSYSFTPFFTWSDNKNILIDVASGNKGGPLDLTGKSSDMGTYGYKSMGIIRTQDQATAIINSRAQAAGGVKNVTIFSTPVQPGMINYQDYNGDGVIDVKDQQYLNKKQSNHYSLGLNWSVNYGSLSLNVIMGASWGGWTTIDGQVPGNNNASSGYSITDNRPSYWADHWTPANTNAKYPAPYFVSDYKVTTDFWLVRATTLNITNATMSYTIPTKWSSKAGIASARFFVVATNPVQFINPFPNHYRDISTALYTYPTLRTITAGLNVGF